MRKNTVVGLDIGTYYVKVVIAQIQNNGTPPHIIGTGSALSRGLRHGYIVNQHDIIDSIKKAVEQAEEEADVKVDRAYLSIGGVGLEDRYSHGEAIVSRANSEVSDIDAENALVEAEARIGRELLNRKVIHAIPVAYLLDGQQILGRPTACTAQNSKWRRCLLPYLNSTLMI